ncbi:Ig-like domain-containing protein [Marinicella rhabdoformis]|uniref:Ig-like domain-containing protein n=1 Tax=Marinicella rhabdoformis TaxID=2580566 RepID=UPI0015D091F4|nr:Ig-like domain-containing protein [Marinicella rhabdoformis]
MKFQKSVLTTAISMAITFSAGAKEIPDQLIIKYKESVNADTARSANHLNNLSYVAGTSLSHRRFMYDDSQVVILEKNFNDSEVKEFIERISQDPTVLYVEEDKLMQPTFTPNDPLYNGNQWHYYEAIGGINAEAAWDITRGAGVNIAVLDTGITNHSDLNGNIVGGYDMISNTFVANDGGGRDADPSDPGDWVTANECGNNPAQDSSWHGTHVAGTIGALTDNGVGVAGVSHLSNVIPVRVLGKCGGLTSDIADAIVWASGGAVGGVPANPNPAQVINMSLGGSGACSNASQNAINAAVNNGTVVVVASGNDNDNVQDYNPGNCNNVISVAANDRNGDRAYYSNFGNLIDITAPGGDVNVAQGGVGSTLNDGAQGPGAETYVFYQGTSMAAPHVAGVAGLMYSVNPNLTPAQVESAIKNTARAFPNGSDCNVNDCGEGIVDAEAAVIAVNQGNNPVLSTGNDTISVCASQGNTAFALTLTDFGNSTDMSVSGCPAGASCNYSVNPVNSPTNSTNLNISGLAGVTPNSYGLTATGTDSVDGNITDDLNLTLSVLAVAGSPGLTQPSNAATDVSTLPTFNWSAGSQASSYQIEISTDVGFSNIVESTTGINGTSYTANNSLNSNTTYFWRVTAENACGTGDSTVFSFTTGNEVCQIYTSSNVPLPIPATGTSGPMSDVIQVNDTGLITDVNVVNLIGTHSWIEDLTFDIQSPAATQVELVSQVCGSNDDFDVNFDDNGGATLPCPYTDGGTYQPSGSLSTLVGEDLNGNWTLNINDAAGGDNGDLTSWGLEICYTPAVTNTPPVAVDDIVSTDEDVMVSVNVLTGDSDADVGDTLSVTSCGTATSGSVSQNVNACEYTPNLNFNGSDSFVYTITDGTDTDTATVNITVDAVNDAPTADAQTVNTTEDNAVGITLTGSDPDSDPLTYSVSAPSNGSLSGTAPNLTYTPDADFNGGDSFTFTVNDGTVDSAAATVTINVSAVNDAPTANAQSVSTDEDVAVGITLTGSDPDSDPLTYSVSAPSNGSLSGTAPNLTYTPDANFNGNDSFTFTVNDGTANSGAATVSITVDSVNDVPTANSQSTSTTEDNAVGITLTGSDPDSDPLTYSVSAPSNGSLSGTAPNLTYTPDADFNGGDSFTFTVNDGTVDSAAATVTINVSAVNDAPTANAQPVSTDEDVAVGITLTGSDPDSDPLTYSVSAPSNGSLSGTAPNLTYTPDANFNGGDSFTFTVNDGTVDSSAATVSITVDSVNDAPTANSQSTSTTEDNAVGITLTGSDPDSDPLTYSVSAPSNGSLSGTAPNLTYTPDADFNGGDSFTFTVNDGTVDSVAATVTINVSAVNDAPTANAQTVNTTEDNAVGITLTGSDPDSDPLTYSVGSPANGSLSGTAPNLTYTPDADFNGGDSFTFTVNDGATNSSAATVSITVDSVNDQPSMTTSEQVYASSSAFGNQLTAPIACYFDMGPDDEDVSQNVRDMLVTVPPNNIISNIDVDDAGQLIYSIIGNPGVVEVEVAMQDDGGDSDGGIDTTVQHTFYINVQDYIFRDDFDKQACDL